jgi:M3 family oligoendopeptidase
MYNIRYIDFYKDVTNEKIEKEIPEIEEKSYDYYDKIFSSLNALYNSDYQDYIFDNFDEKLIAAIANYRETDENYMDLINEESELVLEYESAADNCSVEYNGQTWTADDLYENPPMNASDYNAISNMIYSQKNKKLGDIYLKLIKVRNKIAKSFGYSNYAEYAYESRYIRDYSLDDIEKVYKEVKTSFPDLYNGLYKQLGLSLYSTGLANDTFNGTQVLDTIEPYMAKVDKEIYDNFEYMRKYNLYDIDEMPNKMDCGFTVSLYSYGVPFIYNSPYGDYNDIRTMIHEFGHANVEYTNPSRAIYDDFGCSLDTLEIHSQGLEVLFTDYHDDIFGETKGKAFTDFTIYAMASSVVEGCMFDEFQRFAYENPDCTLEQLNTEFKTLCDEYSVEFNTDAAYTADWTDVAHNFNSPMYYISYATSALSALDLWIEAADDRDSAIDKYKSLIECGSNTPYMESIQSCGLRNIFEEGTVSDIAEQAEYVLNNGTAMDGKTTNTTGDAAITTQTVTTVSNADSNYVKTDSYGLFWIILPIAGFVLLLYIAGIISLVVILIVMIVKKIGRK